MLNSDPLHLLQLFKHCERMKEQRSNSLTSWGFSLLPSILQWQAHNMAHDSCLLVHLRLRDEQGTQLLHLLLPVRPVAEINSVVHLRFSSSACSFWLSVASVDQAANLSLSYLLQFWSMLLGLIFLKTWANSSWYRL